MHIQSPHVRPPANAFFVVLLNHKSGLDSKENCERVLREAFAQVEIRPKIRTIERGEQLLDEARRAVAEGCGTLVAAGGDGTVSACASVVADTEVALGVLPLGTLNHFAKDLGVPLSLADAVRNLAEGGVRHVDVGEVNGRVFINNSSVGLYPALVHHRERQQRLGKHKWSAFARAVWTVLGRYPMIRVVVNVDGLPLVRKTPLVFVGNNPYQMQGLRMGSRARLDRGRLAVYLTRDVGRWRLLWFAVRALFGRLHDAKDFQMLETESLAIRTRRRRMRVAADGEVTHLETPLEYRTRPAALKVIVPKRTDAELNQFPGRE